MKNVALSESLLSPIEDLNLFPKLLPLFKTSISIEYLDNQASFYFMDYAPYIAI